MHRMLYHKCRSEARSCVESGAAGRGPKGGHVYRAPAASRGESSDFEAMHTRTRGI